MNNWNINIQEVEVLIYEVTNPSESSKLFRKAFFHAATSSVHQVEGCIPKWKKWQPCPKVLPACQAGCKERGILNLWNHDMNSIKYWTLWQWRKTLLSCQNPNPRAACWKGWHSGVWCPFGQIEPATPTTMFHLGPICHLFWHFNSDQNVVKSCC